MKKVRNLENRIINNISNLLDESPSFEISPNHNQATRKAKIRNLANKTNNPNEKKAAEGKLEGPKLANEAFRLPVTAGNIYTVLLNWRGQHLTTSFFFPSLRTPRRSDVQREVSKIYPGGKVIQYSLGDLRRSNRKSMIIVGE